MAWSPNTPLATDLISTSQPLLLGNFQALDGWSQVDHSMVAAGVNNGYHFKVTFAPQPAAPAFPVGYDGMYSILNTQTGVNDIFINRADAFNFPMTAAANTTGANVDGYAYLPGGVLCKWVIVNAVAGANTYVWAVNPNVPAFTGVGFRPIILLQGSVAGNVLSLTNNTLLQFTYNSTLNDVHVQAFAFMKVF